MKEILKEALCPARRVPNLTAPNFINGRWKAWPRLLQYLSN